MASHETAITPESFTTFGSLLRYLRQRALLSRAELARAAGYSESQIARLELDQRRPDATAVQARFVPALRLDTQPAWVTRLIALARPIASVRPNPVVPDLPITGDLVSDLLATKLFVPRPQSTLLSRPRLLAQLDRALHLPLTLVAAPAGSGKTTLLANWIASKAEIRGLGLGTPLSKPLSSDRSLRVAWLSLDASDNDLATFVRYLVAACQQLAATVGQTTLALLQQPTLLPSPSLLAPLVNNLAALPDSNVLVLEDLHTLTAPSVYTALTFLVEHLPPQLHLILAGRDDPPLPLARLRGRGQLLEVRAPDLRFQPDESAQFLRESMGMTITDETAALLNARTEGWAAGLQLAALALQGRDDLITVVAALSGSRHYLGDYLTGEVLDHLPAHLKTFVLQTSILERMCGPLCDAVLGATTDDEAPTTDACVDEQSLVTSDSSLVTQPSYSQLMLAELERRQLFIVSLDNERHWYRYHHLFADLLRARLREGGSANVVAALHRRASVWYVGRGLVVEAVQHTLAAHEWEPAARLIKKHGMGLMQSGQLHTVLGWLSALPATVVQISPTLCQVHALGLMFTNQFAAAEMRLHDAENALQPDTSADRARQVRGIVALLQGGIRYYTGDLVQAIRLMEQTLALLPEPTTGMAGGVAIARSRAVAALYMATAYKLTGDVTAQSERRAADAIAPVVRAGYTTETLRSYTALAALQVLQGRLRTAAATYAEVERRIPGQDTLVSLIGSPSYYFGMGDLLREWNDLDAAADYLARGMELVQATLADDGDGILRGYLALASLYQARNHGVAALGILDEFIQLARERQLFHLLIERALALRARLQFLQGDLPAALHWAETSSLTIEDEPSFPHEAAHLTLACLHIATGHVEEIMPLLDRLLVDAQAKARMQSVIHILIVQVLAHTARDERSYALATLEQALRLAEPEGYIRTFVDAGPSIAALLEQWVVSGALNGSLGVYAARLLAAFPQSFS